MVSLDEPEHARLRKPTARAFSMKRVTALVPVIEATTARQLDAVGQRQSSTWSPRLPSRCLPVSSSR